METVVERDENDDDEDPLEEENNSAEAAVKKIAAKLEQKSRQFRTVQFTPQEEKVLSEAGTLGSSFNAPMLITWVYKNVQEEPTLILGLKYIMSHLELGEGCDLLQRHGWCILQIYSPIFTFLYQCHAQVWLRQSFKHNKCIEIILPFNYCVCLFFDDCSTATSLATDSSTAVWKCCASVSPLDTCT